MDKKSPPIITINSLSHDGRGIGYLSGKATFVEGALKGEELEIEYLKRKASWDEAKIVNILSPAPGRKKPACDFFTICGGCSLQHMDNSSQIIHKESVLIEQLLHIGKVTPKEILPPVFANEYGYRRKARLGVRYVFKKEKLLIGFRERNGRYLADIEACSVLHPSIGQNIPLLRDFILSLEAYLHIPQLEVAVGGDSTAIIIRHMEPFNVKDQETMQKFATINNFQIYLQPKGPESAYLFYPQNTHPRLRYLLEDYQLEMLFHPTDFTQVNSEINKKLIQQAIALLKPNQDETLLDLFCGIGNFTLPCSRFYKKVVGVEGSQLMVERGYENALHNAITNVEFHCRNLAEQNDSDSWMQNFDAILLDPPRIGAWEIIQKIPHSNTKKVLYISCNPATLSRDAAHLCQNGFMLDSVGVLDMFPHTSHVESIALFTRK